MDRRLKVDYSARACLICGQSWTPTSRFQATRNKTCSPACMARAVSRSRKGQPNPNRSKPLTCPVCGAMFHRPPSKRRGDRSPVCSHQCRGKQDADRLAVISKLGIEAMKGKPRKGMKGPANPAWKGGVTLKRPKGNYKGVRYVRAPIWALPMARKDGYIMEHRLVMAQMAGRLLTRTEVVNHIDHNPANNDPSNLEMWPTNADHKRGEVGRFVSGVANRVFLEA